MNEHVTAGLLPGPVLRTNPIARPVARSLERRRLQCYLALLLGDIVAIYAGFLIPGSLYLGETGPGQASRISDLILPLFLTVALYNGSYSREALQQSRIGAMRAVQALAIAAALTIFIAFYTKSSAEFSRVLFGSGTIAAVIALIGLRYQMDRFIAWHCGGTVTSQLVIRDEGPPIELPGAHHIDLATFGIVPALNDPVSLHRIGLLLAGVDRVTISCPSGRRATWATILRSVNIEGEVTDETVTQLAAHGARIAGGHGFLLVSVGPLGLRSRAIKRGFDLGLACLGLLVFFPTMLLAALAIRLEDGGPVLFVQRRVGRGNCFFRMYKFRSMRLAALDPHGTRSTQQSDPRLTRVGAFIRRTSIDELPQLLNVLKGEMSIVGPRPHALGSQAGAKLFWEIDDQYWIRHALKPGLTGLAQVRGLRGATNAESDLIRRLGADLEYLNGWSLWRDVAIVVRTLRVLIHPKAF